MEFERFIAVAVAQALDDLDERRLTVEQALLMIARSAYAAGRQQNYEQGGGGSGTEWRGDGSPDPPVVRRRKTGLWAALPTRVTS